MWQSGTRSEVRLYWWCQCQVCQQVRSTYLTERPDATDQTSDPATSRFQGHQEEGGNSTKWSHFLRMAREFYFGEEITEDDLKQFINLNTDVQFWWEVSVRSPAEGDVEVRDGHVDQPGGGAGAGGVPLHSLLPGHVQFRSAPLNTWCALRCELRKTQNIQFLKCHAGSDLGVAHADELPYLFDLFGLNAGTGLYDIWWSEADKLNSARMLRMWSNFVKEQDPTPVEADLGVTWQPVTTTSHQYLRIDKLVQAFRTLTEADSPYSGTSQWRWHRNIKTGSTSGDLLCRAAKTGGGIKIIFRDLWSS